MNILALGKAGTGKARVLAIKPVTIERVPRKPFGNAELVLGSPLGTFTELVLALALLLKLFAGKFPDGLTSQGRGHHRAGAITA